MNRALRLTRPARLLLGLLRIYKEAFSPFLPPACRFFPTCSEYATDAVRKHGVVGGLRRAAVRVLKCHPLHAGGVDLLD